MIKIKAYMNQGRRTKRKVIYAESESEEDAFAGPSLGARSRLNTSRKADSGDEYELGEDDVAIFGKPFAISPVGPMAQARSCGCR